MGVGVAVVVEWWCGLSCPCSSPLHGSPQNNGASPIIVACAKGRRECVRLLLDQGCDLSQVREGVTLPPHVAPCASAACFGPCTYG